MKGKRMIHYGLIAVFLAFQVADCLSTNTALAHGMHEQNPIMIFVQSHMGDHWLFAKLAVAVIIALLMSKSPRLLYPILAVLITAVPPLANYLQLWLG